MDFTQTLEFAERIVRRVGSRIKDEIDLPSGYNINHKGEFDLVTDVDVWAEEQIISAVNREYPEHRVIGEESAPEQFCQFANGSTPISEVCADGVCWIVDPIDGTTNFVHRIPYVGISIGIVADGKLAAGLVYDPVRDEMFSALRGQGACMNGQPISTSAKELVRNAVIVTGFPYDRKKSWEKCRAVYEAFIHNALALRRFGAASLDQCWVACGRFDGFFEYGLRAWDVAGGSIIVQEAGGKTANFSNKDNEEFSILSDTFLFSGQALFPDMLSTAQEAHFSVT